MTHKYLSESKDSGTDREITIKDVLLGVADWWKYLLSKWVIILVCGIIGAIGGLLYAISDKATYTADLTFVLEDADNGGGGLGGALGLASQFGFDVGSGGGGAFSGENLLELMKSRALIEKTLLTPVSIDGKKQTLAEYYIGFNDLRTGWTKNLKLAKVNFPVAVDRSSFTLEQDSVLGSFYNNIVSGNLLVERNDKKSSILLVRVKSIDEHFSKLFAEKLAEKVSDFYIETKTKKSVENLKILQHQTDSVRKALVSGIYGVAAAVDVNPNANPAKQILFAPSKKVSVDVQSNQAILIELVKNLEISKISLRKETPLIQIIDKPILPLPKEKVAKRTGIIVGGILGGIIILIFLVFKRLFNILLK